MDTLYNLWKNLRTVRPPLNIDSPTHVCCYTWPDKLHSEECCCVPETAADVQRGRLMVITHPMNPLLNASERLPICYIIHSGMVELSENGKRKRTCLSIESIRWRLRSDATGIGAKNAWIYRWPSAKKADKERKQQSSLPVSKDE
jgi:hypothetical protein